MKDKITLYAVTGHSGLRCQKQIQNIRFVEDFYGTEEECQNLLYWIFYYCRIKFVRNSN